MVWASITGASPTNGDTVVLRVMRQDGQPIPNYASIAPAPVSQMTLNDTIGIPRYLYGLEDGSGTTPWNDVTWAQLPVGDYWFYCAVTTAPNQCNGNPGCWYETIGPNWFSCSLQVSCREPSESPTDNAAFSVVGPTGNITCTDCSYGWPATSCSSTVTWDAVGVASAQVDQNGTVIANGLSGSTTASLTGASTFNLVGTPVSGPPVTIASDTCTGSTTNYTISGNVYVDTDNDAVYNLATGRCTDPDGVGPAWTGATGTDNVRLVPAHGSGGIIDASGAYTITNVQSGYSGSATALLASPGWQLSNCTSNTINPVTGNLTGVNFFVTQSRSAWWQTIGGDVGANNGNITSNIPDTCVASATCEEFITLFDAANNADSSGVIVHYAGTVSAGTGGGSLSEGTDYNALSLYDTTAKEDYAYFYRLFEMPPNASDDIAPDGNANPPSGPPADGKYAYFQSGDLNIGPNNNWNISSSQSIVIFVDGKLTFDFQLLQGINVDPGGFLAFIVNGDITFNANVGSNAPGNPNTAPSDVEGIFITDSSIIIASSPNQFVGEGVFVGWNGVNLGRDLTGFANTTYPAEIFRYRPDLIINTPDRFKKPYYTWEEVAP
ncbi:hypothetical protein A3A66_04670 [Microgenomates group bacterium RIFCSPLOWO2_01_FULL_46_13]|nr:MAG: hypothetical protein A3A66_04670 [Microgenomates group bacterium RIFCSPLOWO2_01_FULL_46_13]